MKVHPGMLMKTQEGRAQEDSINLQAGRRATNLALTHDVSENKDG
jgi:hypothetical protein